MDRRAPPPRPATPAVPARSAVRRLTRGVASAEARGAPGPRTRGRPRGWGAGSAARQQVGASSRARARPVPSPSRSPRAASPPRRERAASRPRAGSVSASQSRTLRGAPATAVASAPRCRVPGLFPSSATPFPFPALLSHTVHGESLDTKQADVRRGLEKWRCRAWIIPSAAPPAPVRR